jgi:hydrogenase maturation protease
MSFSSVNPSRILIVGLGNVFMGDDGFGPLTVEVFRCAYECSPEVEIIDLGTPGLDLAPYLYGRDLVLMVDVVQAEGEPGTLRTYREADFLGNQARLRLTDHDPGLQESLEQLRLIDRAPAKLIVIGVIAQSCVFGKRISQGVVAATSGAIAHIVRLLLQHGAHCRRRQEPLQLNSPWLLSCPRNQVLLPLFR